MPRAMRSIHAYEYGGLEKLQLTDSLRTPVVRRADEVLVRVRCSTVQPIDLALLSGYGSVLLPVVARMGGAADPPLPLILGRDFCGEVVAVGPAVPRDLRPGRLVWGARAPFEPGCHAEFAIARAAFVRPLPTGVDPAVAVCLAYPGLTALAAMRAAGLPAAQSNVDGSAAIRRPDPAVLVLGASGGLGILLAQLLRHRLPACRLTVTCPARHAVALPAALGSSPPEAVVVAGAGADTDAVVKRLAALAPFDAVIDLTRDPAAQRRILPLLRSGGNSALVTLSSPVLRLFDTHGLLGGAVRAAGAYLADSRAGVRYAMFSQSGPGLDYLAGLMSDGRLAPLVGRRYPMAQFRQAFECASGGGGGGRDLGRVVIDVD